MEDSEEEEASETEEEDFEETIEIQDVYEEDEDVYRF